MHQISPSIFHGFDLGRSVTMIANSNDTKWSTIGHPKNWTSSPSTHLPPRNKTKTTSSWAWSIEHDFSHVYHIILPEPILGTTSRGTRISIPLCTAVIPCNSKKWVAQWEWVERTSSINITIHVFIQEQYENVAGYNITYGYLLRPIPFTSIHILSCLTRVLWKFRWD